MERSAGYERRVGMRVDCLRHDFVGQPVRSRGWNASQKPIMKIRHTLFRVIGVAAADGYLAQSGTCEHVPNQPNLLHRAGHDRDSAKANRRMARQEAEREEIVGVGGFHVEVNVNPRSVRRHEAESIAPSM